MADFIYTNAKNTSIDNIFYKFLCKYHFYISHKKNLNHCSKLKIVEEPSSKL